VQQDWLDLPLEPPMQQVEVDTSTVQVIRVPQTDRISRDVVTSALAASSAFRGEHSACSLQPSAVPEHLDAPLKTVKN